MADTRLGPAIRRPASGHSAPVRYQKPRCKEQGGNSDLRGKPSPRWSQASLSLPQRSSTTPAHGLRAPVQLTRRLKLLVVLGRLVEPDAPELSDRAIARELGVSQPFVSKLRRRVGPALLAEIGE